MTLIFLCPFFSSPHGDSLASCYDVRRKLLPKWTFTTDCRHACYTKKESGFYIHPNSYFVQSPTKTIYFLFSYPIEKNRIDIATNVIDRGNALAANTIGL